MLRHNPGTVKYILYLNCYTSWLKKARIHFFTDSYLDIRPKFGISVSINSKKSKNNPIALFFKVQLNQALIKISQILLFGMEFKTVFSRHLRKIKSENFVQELDNVKIYLFELDLWMAHKHSCETET